MAFKKRLTIFFVLLSTTLLFLAACEAAGEQPVDTTPTIDPGLPPEVGLTAQAWLAGQLGVDVTQVTMVSSEQVEWPDSCLGLGQANESCAAVITPGWSFLFEVEGQQYEVRTDETGAAMRSPQLTGTAEMPGAPEITGELAGTQWQLESFGPAGAETPVVAGTTVTLEFDAAGQAGGNGGCNTFGAQYQVQNGALDFSEIVSTLMACADASVNEQEQQYLAALETAAGYELSGDRLVITYNDGQSVLNFVSASAAYP